MATSKLLTCIYSLHSTLDNLQDFFISLEDTLVPGYSTAVAWKYDEEENVNINTEELFEMPEMSVKGVMGWLTGQRHKHILPKEKPSITLNFDHDCLLRNPNHTTCFPLVGACGRELTISVVHMCESGKFKEIFVMAYCKGQSFAKA